MEWHIPNCRTALPLKALVSAMRPRQWVKNGLIVDRAGRGGRAHPRGHLPPHGGRVPRVLLRLLGRSTCSTTFATPRPIASTRPSGSGRSPSGQLALWRRQGAADLLLLVGFAIPFALWHPEGLFLVLGLYVVIQVNYILWLKNLAIIELGAVASGFFLRAYAGAVTSHIDVSTWFLVVISFGALFLVVGKRTSELKNLGVNATRPVLGEYTLEFLRSALTLSATVVVTGYCLWAFDTSITGLSSIHHDFVPIRLTVVPVVFAVLFILRSADRPMARRPKSCSYTIASSRCSSLIWVWPWRSGLYG